MRTKPTLTVLILAVLLTSWTSAQEGPTGDTILGALADSPPLLVQVGGMNIQVFDAARNVVDMTDRLKWAQMTYYYDAPLRIRRAGGQLQIGNPIPDQGAEVIELELEPVPVDPEVIAKAIRDAHKNEYADATRVLPLTIFGFRLGVLGSEVTSQIFDNGHSLSQPLFVQLRTPLGSGDALRQRLLQGTNINLSVRTLIKLSALASVAVTIGDLRRTTTFQHYTGPSGPGYVTAAQAVNATTEILGELRMTVYQEGSAGSFPQLFDSIFRTIIVDRRQRQEVALDKLADPKQFMIDPQSFQNQRDIITRIASDAANLSDQAWCNKYKNSLDRLNKGQSVSSSDLGFGLNVVIPEIDLPLGLDFSSKSSDQYSQESRYKYLLDTQNCGRNIVKSSFKYELNGQINIPISIYVFQSNKVGGNVSDSAVVSSYNIHQRYGDYDKSFRSNR